ncbi:MAG: NAD(+) kinase [Gammaproteobacteria bacterium]|nr:NAD(+) kinase [Gammaproteobacteria bacterium]MBU2546295.1 NAD(+) kinase [Gammaproteobacteria bacterium]
MKFHHIGLITKLHSPLIEHTVKKLAEFLKEKKLDVLIEANTAKLLKNIQLSSGDYQTLKKHCDLLIVIGGDGSFLHVARDIVSFNLPVIGINRGTLGFLTDIHPTEMTEKLEEILSGHYVEEKRFMLEVFTRQGRKIKRKACALNEVVVTTSSVAQMIEFEIYINQTFMCSQRSDGLITTTPTGSTAYALSAGGPIVHPALDVITLIPMFPHTLNSRPIVLDSNQIVKIVLQDKIRALPHIYCDSQVNIKVDRGDTIYIHKLDQSLRLIHPMDYDYYKALRSKLDWGKKLVP